MSAYFSNNIEQALSVADNNFIALYQQGERQAIADQLKMSKRSIQIKAKALLGVPLGTNQRKSRLVHALKLFLTKDAVPLTEIAHESGYFDQAHLNKDFRHYIGLSPSQIRRNKQIYLDFFLEEK